MLLFIESYTRSPLLLLRSVQERLGGWVWVVNRCSGLFWLDTA